MKLMLIIQVNRGTVEQAEWLTPILPHTEFDSIEVIDCEDEGDGRGPGVALALKRSGLTSTEVRSRASAFYLVYTPFILAAFNGIDPKDIEFFGFEADDEAEDEAPADEVAVEVAV